MDSNSKYSAFLVLKTKLYQSPKIKYWAQNQYDRVIHPSIENFTWSKKKYTFRGQKGENKL
jgi:hypothetical protein